MPKLTTLINKITQDHPKLKLESGERFAFHPPNTIFYDEQSGSERPDLLILHELGHYLNGNQDYTSDIALLRIESEAWETAKKLTKKYKIKWDEDFAQDRLDSYRDWMHSASLCSFCNINGYQDTNGLYHCPLCNKKWPRQEIPED